VIEKLRTSILLQKESFFYLLFFFFFCICINPILDGESLTSMKCEALSSLIVV
jgi:hypothetical protein